MARRRKSRRIVRARSVARRSAPVKRRSSKRSSSSGMKGTLGLITAGGLAGAGQEAMDDYLVPRVDQYLGMFGQYSGNVARIGGALAVRKFVKNSKAKTIASNLILLEGADIGKQLYRNVVGGSVTGNTVSISGTNVGTVYGA